MRLLHRSMLVPAAIASIGLLGAARLRHNHLIKSDPAAGDSVRLAPREIHLRFSERPELSFTSITLLAADSAKVPIGRATAGADSLEVSVPLQAGLASGRYAVLWRTAGQDGHAVRGRFEFSVLK